MGLKKAFEVPLKIVRRQLRNVGLKLNIRTKSVVDNPKSGSVLPVLLTLAGPSALGILECTVECIIIVVKTANQYRQQLGEVHHTIKRWTLYLLNKMVMEFL